MLESLAAQLQTLQEVVVLDSDRPLSDLLGRVIDQASQLLGSDGCCVYRYDSEQEVLEVAAATGSSPSSGELPVSRRDDPIVRALADREPVPVPGGEGGGALLAVPLLVRNEAYGVLALTYRGEREFTDLDVRLAASFGGQVALAIENARLRDEIGQAAAATERSRLARDLHDSVTQSLFAASLKAEAIRRRWRPTTDEARENVEDVERLARGALAEMRNLLMEMRPDTLAEASLTTLLEQLAAATEGGSRVTVHHEVQGRPPAAAGGQRRAVPHRPGGPPEREPPFRSGRGVGYARPDRPGRAPHGARRRARVRRGDGDPGALRARHHARARSGGRRRGHGRELRRAPARR